MNKICDLHTHSLFSDGTLTPEEIVTKALEKGLSAVALTDHNNILGLDEFFVAAENKITAVGGVEISAQVFNKEVHVLGLFVTPNHYNAINSFLDEFKKQKIKCYDELYKNLIKHGYNISYDNIKKSEQSGIYNRVHFAQELIRCGYVSSVKEAFSTVLSEKNGIYKAAKRMSALHVIAFLKQNGIVPVLAHPFLNLNLEELEEFLPKAKENGLMGIETDYSLFSEEETKNAHMLAEKFNLIKSGGSDFHGSNKPHIDLAVGKGNLKIPYEYYEQLNNAK